MKQAARRLASPRLTIAGFALLGAGALANYNLPDTPVAVITGPLVLLALNLAAALAVRPALRRGGLGLFHVALLVMLVLAGFGRMTHFDGRVEIAEGTLLDPTRIETTSMGPWHGTDWQGLSFRQGPYEVNYAAGVRRSDTRSAVTVPGADVPMTVGDDTPLVLDGYRFYTTHNKGFAPMLAWQPAGGEAVRGVLHMPSYPLFDWKQENLWTAPDGSILRFWLRIDRPLPTEVAWTLDPHEVPVTLVIEAGGSRHEVKPGEAVVLAGATLRFERLLGWMGYRIFYDPTLIPMLLVSLIGVLGLAWHLWGAKARLLPLNEGVAA